MKKQSLREVCGLPEVTDGARTLSLQAHTRPKFTMLSYAAYRDCEWQKQCSQFLDQMVSDPVWVLSAVPSLGAVMPALSFGPGFSTLLLLVKVPALLAIWLFPLWFHRAAEPTWPSL